MAVIDLRPHVDRLRAAWRGPALDDALAGRLRARQVQAVLRLTPLALATNLLNVVVVASAFWHLAPKAVLLGWAIVTGLVILQGMRAWVVARARPPRESASPRAIRRAVLQAALLGLLWAVPPVVLFDRGDLPAQLLLAAVITGMMCAGGFALATVPQAGTVWVLMLGVGAGIALLRADMPLGPVLGLLLLAYGVIVLVSVWSTARLFDGRLVAEAQAERQNEVIGLLLRDFEENASDVLWEIGPDGHLRHVSPKLAALLRRPASRLIARPAMHWLEAITPADAESREQLAGLRARLAEGAPFRDQCVAAQRGGQRYWWSLTAKPLLDAQGRAAGWRGVAADITASRRAHQQLSWLAHHDALTGLGNRHRFRARLAALLADEPVTPLALLCLDLDHFKGINDTLGHARGDELLRAVGARLAAAVRRDDLVARLGGDEFAVLLPGVHRADEAELLARSLLEALREPFEVHGARVAVRSSIGVALAPADGRDVDSLLNHADIALYEAKGAGRGEVRCFRSEMATHNRRRITLEEALREALARGELRLVFQPQVDFSTWRISGFEALLRWRHATLGEVAPTEFVQVAEESGLMPSIGEWVLREACRHAATWPERLTVAVNVSPVQLLSPRLAETAPAIAREAGLAPQRLELEITESTFLRDTRATMEVLHALRRAGLRIALDDFGTGYSALGYLRRFPFDRLKIDRSFVRELLTRADARAIVRTILGLTRTLRMEALAEGVEEPAHASLLQRYGCNALQGHLVSRPLEADRVGAFLVAWRAEPRPVWQVDVPSTASMPL